MPVQRVTPASVPAQRVTPTTMPAQPQAPVTNSRPTTPAMQGEAHQFERTSFGSGPVTAQRAPANVTPVPPTEPPKSHATTGTGHMQPQEPRVPQDVVAAGMGLEAGARIHQYELIRELGRGGMGMVWAARDT